MDITNPLLTRWICAGLVMALLTPAAIAQDEKQDATPVPPSQTSQTSSPTPDASPTSAPAETQASQATPTQLPDSPDKVQPQAESQAQPSTAAPPPQSNPQQPPPGKTPKPVGAAAAEVQGPTGDAAFKPAGAAIAPAKQRRARMLLIKVGALIGAGVAIGSVAALSSASPSRPPGAH